MASNVFKKYSEYRNFMIAVGCEHSLMSPTQWSKYDSVRQKMTDEQAMEYDFLMARRMYRFRDGVNGRTFLGESAGPLARGVA